MGNYSIIVCYQPNVQALVRLCEVIINEGAKVILVDNTKVTYVHEGMFPQGCKVVPLGKNTGIAHAQNIGIKLALRDDADLIVFFDQDSTVETGLFTVLISKLNIGVPEIVSPCCVDDLDNIELPALRINRYGIPRAVYKGDSNSPYPVDVIISSGTAVTKEVFKVVGQFEEDLFIDYVDTEWCFRCRNSNVPIRVIPEAIMYHRIGLNVIKVGPITVQIHSPERCYYQIRNSFYLFRCHHVPFLFSVKELISIIANRLLLLMFVKNRLKYIKIYARAMSDGFLGVVGPLTLKP